MMPNKKPMAYGLNIRSDGKSSANNRVKGIFNEDEEEVTEVKGVEKSRGLNKKREVNQSSSNKALEDKDLNVDPSVYEYDEIYDQMKASERSFRQSLKQGDSKKPRYIKGMLETAELRKRDRLRAEEKMIQKERELEGDMFKDKEKFVTSAYKKQQEELKKLEGKDNVKETNSNVSGMASFYKEVLNNRSKQIEAAMLKNDTKVKVQINNETQEKEDLYKKAIEEGKKVEINENGELIDKRQLLSAGLNVLKKPKKSAPQGNVDSSTLSAYEEFVQRRKKAADEAKESAKRAQARRNAQILKTQMEETRVLTEKEKIDKMNALKATLERGNDNSSISDARTRYLARKKLKENE